MMKAKVADAGGNDNAKVAAMELARNLADAEQKLDKAAGKEPSQSVEEQAQQ